MQNTIGSYDAKTKLPEILRRVESGESFIITNRGRPVAELVPFRHTAQHKSKAAINHIMEVEKIYLSDSDFNSLIAADKKVKGFVLDNSVAMRWLLASMNQQDQRYAENVLLSLAHNEAFVPNLWHLEAANVLLGAQKRQEINESVCVQFLLALEDLPIILDTLTATKAFDTTSKLARLHNLSSYDAAYLELAIRENKPIATLNKNLISAAKNAGVALYLKD